MKVTNVKVLDGKVTVLGKEPNGVHEADVALKSCPDTPEKAFLSAMAAVEKEIKALDAHLAADDVKLYGVAVSTDGHGHRSFVFDFVTQYAWGVQHAAIPLLREPVDAESGPSVLSASTVKTIDSWLYQASRYYAQERQQLKLDLGDDEKKKATA